MNYNHYLCNTMKKINNFLLYSSNAKLFIVFTMFFLLFFFFFTKFLMSWVFLPSITLSLLISLLGGTLLTISIKYSKNNIDFWEMAMVVERKIQLTTAASELKIILFNDISDLKYLSMGGVHLYEINRLVSIINTKLQYVH